VISSWQKGSKNDDASSAGNQFASFVEKIKSIKANQRQSTEKIEGLFHTLMQKAFRGELKVAKEAP